MKIGIIADSHENMDLIDQACEIMKERNVEVIFHAGDIISPIALKHFKNCGCLMIAVFGNNDGEKLFLQENIKSFGNIFSGIYEGELAGKRIIMMHEPKAIDSIASSGDYDLIIYGHTHEIDIRKVGNSLIINPGELCGYLKGKRTFVIMDIPSMEYEVIEL
ncbi:MAG: hypothetical protein DRI22_02300 [Caldiserica bacterium]|nr:MAG: hypothetical protein DRI22_02300 [Caldisericota bacterium]